jgi:hypothetical protein
VTELIRWNAGFVRGLAQSVLDRAKVIRLSLDQAAGRKPLKKVAKKVAKKAVKKAVKKVVSDKKTRKIKKVKKANA